MARTDPRCQPHPFSERFRGWVVVLFGMMFAGSAPSNAQPPAMNEPVVARVEMRLADGEKLLDVIEKGDLLTVLEVRDDEYVILTHDGSRGVVDKVNAVKLAESTDIYTELIEANPEEGRFHTLRASAWFALGKSDKALEDFDAAIEKGYEEAHAFSSRGLFHAATGQPKQAIEDYDEAIRRDPDDVAPLINRAAANMMLGRFEVAADDYSRAIQLRPDDLSLLRQRALAYKSAKKFDQAIEDFGSILETNPEDFQAVMGRGYVHFQKLDFQAATDSFTRAIELRKDDAVAWNNRGYNRYQLGQVVDALKDYEQAIELAPSYGLALQNRAWLLATTEDEELRQPAEAVKSAKAACELSNFQNISDLSALAAALAAQGKYQDAVGWQEKVVEKAPEQFKEFAQKMLARYQDERPYAADPDAATKRENEAAEKNAPEEPTVASPESSDQS